MDVIYGKIDIISESKWNSYCAVKHWIQMNLINLNMLIRTVDI